MRADFAGYGTSDQGASVGYSRLASRSKGRAGRMTRAHGWRSLVAEKRVRDYPPTASYPSRCFTLDASESDGGQCCIDAGVSWDMAREWLGEGGQVERGNRARHVGRSTLREFADLQQPPTDGKTAGACCGIEGGRGQSERRLCQCLTSERPLFPEPERQQLLDSSGGGNKRRDATAEQTAEIRSLESSYPFDSDSVISRPNTSPKRRRSTKDSAGGEWNKETLFCARRAGVSCTSISRAFAESVHNSPQSQSHMHTARARAG
ncbi:hypothetical protein L1887_58677 [Cichorium endivia]|nr:hypothetical protein L1887_58677 [Cichorium endivia]